MVVEFARSFVLNRTVDETGVSGTGVVAWGVQFPDGVCVIRWASEHRSTAVFASLDDVVDVHGHGGLTEIIWHGDETAAPILEPAGPARVLVDPLLHDGSAFGVYRPDC